MANQKQRRRRAKEKRHEYELVEIDAEGNETVLTSSELKPDEPEKSKAPTKAKGGGSQPAPRGRQPQPPSWQRVAKRGLIFAPIFFATVLLLGRGKVSTAGAVVQTLLLLAIFVPFSYVMDRFVYRSAMKRTAKQTGTRGARP